MDTKIGFKFLGGVADGDNLTGSCTLITIRQGKNIVRLLIDAGLIQCNIKQFNERNRAILKEVKPELLDFVVLTHAHTDHGSRLPLLVKNGFGGKARIICTEATKSILGIMLEDTAKIQAETFSVKTKSVKNESRQRYPKTNSTNFRARMTLGKHDRVKAKAKAKQKLAKVDTALFTLADVTKTCSLIKNGGCAYQEWIKLFTNGWLKFYESGHVLGGAICVIRIKTRTKDVYLGFSGDLGRRDGIILPPPAKIKESIDYWFTESTYGGKVHPAREVEIQKLIGIVKEAVQKKQKIIIPTFALERAQEIIYLLSYYMQTGEIPKINIYLDSPMATKITDVFADKWEEGMFADQGKLKFNPFARGANEVFKVVSKRLDSVALVATPGPYVVIAGSGMCDAGRVRDHLRAGLGNSNTVICLVGYMAENSLGSKLKKGLPIINMNGQEIIIEAKVVAFDSFSAHADSSFLVAYAKETLGKADNKQKIFIIHGEEVGAACLKLELMAALQKSESSIMIPELNQEIEIAF